MLTVKFYFSGENSPDALPKKFNLMGVVTAPGPKYALPSLTGYDGHDPEGNKSRAPAYSLRVRLRDGKTMIPT